MAQCAFSGFIEKNKQCPYPARPGGELCMWHDPDARKDTPDIRGKLEEAIRRTGKDMEGFLLRGADLSGMDLSGADMKDIDLREARLDGANLAGADLRGGKLNRVSAVGATFENANLMAASLSFGNFTNANFRGVNFRIVHVEYANFVGADFEGSDKRHTQFINVKMGDAPAGGARQSSPGVLDQPTRVSLPAGEEPLFDAEEAGMQPPPSPQPPPVRPVQPVPSPAAAGPHPPAARPTAGTHPVSPGSAVPSRGRHYLLVSVLAGLGTGILVLVLVMGILAVARGRREPGGKPPETQGVSSPESIVPPKVSPTTTGGPDIRRAEPSEETPAAPEKEDLVRFRKDLEKAVLSQKKMEEAYRAAEEKAQRLAGAFAKERNDLDKVLRLLRDRVAEAEKRESALRRKLAEAEKQLAAARKDFEEKEKSLREAVALLGRKLETAEKTITKKKGTFKEFADVIARLRETNDGLVKEYEKKLREYRAKIARLSRLYERDQGFTGYNYDHFLVGWNTYTVVGSPSGTYVVGVKFKRTSSRTVTTDMFMLGIRGSAQPVFKVVIFDAKGNKMDVDLKTMASRVIGKGEILTASKKWSAPVPPRYFSIDFVR